jgi:hypothetical protein
VYGHVNSCIDLFSNSNLYSIDRLTTELQVESRTLTEEKLRFYSYADYLALRGKLLSYTYSTELLGDNSVSVEKTEILSLEDLPTSRRNLVKKLFSLQTKSKFLRKKQNLEYLKSFNYLADTIKRIRQENAYPTKKIKSMALEDVVRSKEKSVEVGVFIINLKDGRSLFVEHTSSRHSEIIALHFNKAINEVSNKNNLQFSDVASIEYFHTHPDVGPLSHGDIAVIRSIKNTFETSGHKIKVHMSAIMNINGIPIISHYGE